MTSVFDTLFLRAPRLHYVSPAICEVLFSSSAEPTIVLDPISRYTGPTGPVRGGTGGNYYFRWSTIPGLLCYTVYRADNNEAVYEPLYECLNPGAIVICSSGNFEIFEQTAEGEASVATFSCDGVTPVITVMVSTVNTLGYKVVKNGVLTLWEGIMPPIIEICEPGCYKVSGISPDGETPLSEEICYECTEELPCLPSQVWSWDDCACVTCPEQPCVPGTHWDADTCTCIPDAGPCVPFIDPFGLTSANVGDAHLAVSNGTGVLGNFSDTYRFVGRVLSVFQTDPNDSASIGGITAAGGTSGANYGVDGYLWYRDPLTSTVTTFGPSYWLNIYNFRGAATLTPLVAYEWLDDSTRWHVAVWTPTGGVDDIAPTGIWDDIHTNSNAVGPNGHLNYTKEDYSDPVYHSYVRDPLGTHTDTGITFAASPRQCVNATGQVVIEARQVAIAAPHKLYFWNGATGALLWEPTYGCRIGGLDGAGALNSNGTIVGFASQSGGAGTNGPGRAFRWTNLGGIEDLGVPGGAAYVNAIWVDDEELIYAMTDIGPFYYWAGSWGPMSDIIPISGTDWSAITDVQSVSIDGHVLGRGTYQSVVNNYFLAKCCPPT